MKYTLGTLSHSMNYPVKGYVPLPDWPETTLNSKSRHELAYQGNIENNGKSFSNRDKQFQNISELPSRSFIGWNSNSNHGNTTIQATTTSAPKRYITLDEFYNTSDEDDDDDDEG